jgi:hypothetical protein
MAQSVTASARVPVSADERLRDDVAWNLPRRAVATLSRTTGQHGLDWDGFVDAYFPGSRRHDLEAIVAYGAYKRGVVVAAQTSRLR